MRVCCETFWALLIKKTFFAQEEFETLLNFTLKSETCKKVKEISSKSKLISASKSVKTLSLKYDSSFGAGFKMSLVMKMIQRHRFFQPKAVYWLFQTCLFELHVGCNWKHPKHSNFWSWVNFWISSLFHGCSSRSYDKYSKLVIVVLKHLWNIPNLFTSHFLHLLLVGNLIPSMLKGI